MPISDSATGAALFGDDAPVDPEHFTEPPDLGLVEVGDRKDVDASVTIFREVAKKKLRAVPGADDQPVHQVGMIVEQGHPDPRPEVPFGKPVRLERLEVRLVNGGDVDFLGFNA
jgi:hypothetical protein